MRLGAIIARVKAERGVERINAQACGAIKEAYARTQPTGSCPECGRLLYARSGFVRYMGAILWTLAALGYHAQWGVLGAADAGAPHLRKRIWICGRRRRRGTGRTEQRQRARTCRRIVCLGERFIQRWSTPTARDAGSLAHVTRGKTSKEKGNEIIQPLPVQVGGSLNPTWVCLLMGWPRSWVDLEPMSKEEFSAWLEMRDPWADGWEDGIPRVTSGVKNRVDQLRALGNGQVPAAAALAWRILSR
jgi:DNA (cytosine-5)-methyltransferase 1